MRVRFAAAVLWSALVVAAARGQSIEDGGEVWTSEPVYRGVRANAAVPAWLHILNEGGSDGAGLCVVASNTLDGLYQGVPEFAEGKGSNVWRLAKERPGGYYPEKLEGLFRDAGLETAWFQAEGDAAELLAVIEHYNRQGIPVGITWNFGEHYGTNIHHMVSLIHLDSEMACIVDNNFPGEYVWVSRDELAKRIVDGPAGWVVVLLWLKGSVNVPVLAAAGGLALAAVLNGAAVSGGLLVLLRRPR
ncbi:hypothetical protein [Paludisphaera soli]|uniref:hypothetical protein n=1 Tax=Paludisphaera soli TaxID=2712865 RepID=UPI0013E9C0C9|nr:hypothetical protein [Paludisphaera soli]